MKVITVDFDETMTIPEKEYGFGWTIDSSIWVSSDNPNKDFIDYLRSLKTDNVRMFIVTSRKSSLVDEIYTFLTDHGLSDLFDGVYCTNGEFKHTILSDLNSQLHFDDDIEEFKMNELNGIETIIIPHPLDVANGLLDNIDENRIWKK